MSALLGHRTTILATFPSYELVYMYLHEDTVDLEIFVYRNFRMINFRVKIFS